MRWERELAARKASKRQAAIYQVALSLLVGESVRVIGPDAEEILREAEALASRAVAATGRTSE
jgi:ribosomal protein L17